MTVNLTPIEDLEFTKTERNIFNVIKIALQAPVNSTVKAQKIDHDVQAMCAKADSLSNLLAILS